MNSKIEPLVRKNILKLHPYSCARDEFQGEAAAFLDANESPYNNPYNRYPDPLQHSLKKKIARIKGVRPTQIMIGNGSDEPIDLLIRIFCEPGEDNIVAIAPTYGMYKVCADINNIEYKPVLLDENFNLNAENLLSSTNSKTKMIFLCSPNNPSGNLLDFGEIRKIADQFQGILVLDEAYIDFAPEASWLNVLEQYPKLVVLQTFSKAWGLASIRCGMAFASEEIIAYFNKIKYPYNINYLTQRFMEEQVDKTEEKENWVKRILEERIRIKPELEQIPIVEKVYLSDANFFLVKMTNAPLIYKKLAEQGIVVRSRHSIVLCDNCLRITVGTRKENELLLKALNNLCE